MDLNINYPDFILPAFENKQKYTIIRAGRQIGKTYNAFAWIFEELLTHNNCLGLWVDTVQTNLDKYVDIYVKKILGEVYSSCYYNKQAHKLVLPNGSVLFMASAEKPENLEGLSYDFIVLNEAGIILKNDGSKEGLWDKTIKPMTKNAKVKIIGTPKGKGTKYDLLCQQSRKDDDWAEFVYSCYDSPYWDTHQLDKLKQSEPQHIWEQEYMAEFTDVYENAIIKTEWIKYYTYLPKIKSITIHNDLTHTGKTSSDFFCCCVVGLGEDNNFYVLDWVLEKTDPINQSNILIAKYMQYKSMNVVKMTYDAQSNDAWGEWTKKEAITKGISLPLEPLKIKTDKIVNLTSILPHFVSGRVFLNENHAQLQEALKQLYAFPNKKIHDDFIDGLACCLHNFDSDSNIINENWQEYWRTGNIEDLKKPFTTYENPII
jgi:predicted phage terminase large subunit-like protein